MRKLARRFFDLDRTERTLVFEAWRWLLHARVSLWVLPFSRVQQRYAAGPAERHGPRGSGGPGDVATAIRRARHLVPAADCLPQALAAQAMLRRRGIACTVRIGVARDVQDELEAHAWVEVAGQVVVGDLPDLSRLEPLTRSPARTP